MSQSKLTEIINYPTNPVKLFNEIIESAQFAYPLLLMNLATMDPDYGVLNRSVQYCRLTDNCVTYITQRYTRNYHNLIANPKACITFYWPNLVVPSQGKTKYDWQIRLIGATAEELPETHLDDLWENEPLTAKIRTQVCPCGEPVDFNQLKNKHDDFLNNHLLSGQAIQRPPTFTAFKFIPKRWDFLKVRQNEIADRLQYRLQDSEEWLVMHVAT